MNNLLWALFGRYWGWDTGALQLGATGNQVVRTFSLDSESSQKAVWLGGTLKDVLDGNPTARASDYVSLGVHLMWDTNNLIDSKLWPSPFLANTNTSHLVRPTLLY